MPVQSKARQYEEQEVDLISLSESSLQTLGKRPFRWQLEAAQAVLCGQDVILDVGTGCGKSLCFVLPLLLDKTDISVTVSPLTALMIDQVSTSALSTVAVCHETVSRVMTPCVGLPEKASESERTTMGVLALFGVGRFRRSRVCEELYT